MRSYTRQPWSTTTWCKNSVLISKHPLKQQKGRCSVFLSTGYLRTQCMSNESLQISHALLAGMPRTQQWRRNPEQANRWWFRLRWGVFVVLGGNATSVSPKAHSPNGCNEQGGERPGACEKTWRQRRRDRLRDPNTDGRRDGDRAAECETQR